MEVLYYRDCQGYPHYKLAICDAQGAKVDGPLSVTQKWDFALTI